MIEDLRDASGPLEREADVCIVGGGPAGLAIARAFLGTRYRVLLLESGGMDCEASAHALLAGRAIGPMELQPGLSRLRAFGGSCRRWGGGCMPLARGDFERRDWVDASGWPIGYGDIQPHYRDALRFCGLDPERLSGDGLRARKRRDRLRFDANQLVDQAFLKTGVEFGGASRAELAAAGNVHVLLHANLLELHADPGAEAVRSATIGTLDGRHTVVRARHYVLAAGGIENARLLLLSRSVMQAGLGNGRDQVGRWFHEHPRCRLGTLVHGRTGPLVRKYGRKTAADGVTYLELALSERVQREQRLLSARVRPFPVFAPPSRGMQALRELRSGFTASPAPPGASERLENEVTDALDAGLPPPVPPPDAQNVHRTRALLGALGHPGQVAAGAVRVLRSGTHLRREHVALEAYFEQAPNPASRITLDDARDALGQQRVRVDWRLGALDHATHRQAGALFGTRMAQACGARFVPEPWLEDPVGKPELHGSAHHMGTTRMSADPATGVVDPQCRVHGIDNLYVAGSSVFPTGGWAFPTLTIVALSLRLADHLRTRLEALEPLSHLLGA